MNEQQQDKELLKKIHTGEAKMLPKSYFTLKTVLVALSLLVVLVLAIFFCSFVIFYLRASGYTVLPRFGFLGLRDLFLYFPWLIVAVVLLFLLSLAYIVSKQTAAYKTPVLYSAGVILVLVVVAGFAVANTPLHMGFLNSAKQGDLPVFGGLYMGYGMMQPHDMFIGVVKNLQQNSFELQTGNSQTIFVNLDQNTHFPSGKIKIGDTVMVMGILRGSTLAAYGVLTINDENSAYPQGMMPMHNQMMGGGR
ncbi:MAG: hypothetical protein WC794_05995 [Candidatus Doudnabacteria bacterium]|jgi:hypothetical protein